MAWMRHKPEDEPGGSPTVSSSSPSTTVTETSSHRPVPPSPSPSREPQVGSGKTVNIGPSVHIKGTLSGREDLTVDGKVEGKITLKEHVLTIGANGQIEAELQAKAVVVHGKVVGNITADNKVEVASSGTVSGDIRAPRVSISDGAKFKGSIDMDVGAANRETRSDRPHGQSSSPGGSEMPRSAKAAG